MKKILIMLIVIISLVVFGCTNAPKSHGPAEQTPVSDVSQAPVQRETQTPVVPDVPEPTATNILKIGQTTFDSNIKVTVNKVSFLQRINQRGSVPAEAPDGKTYVVVDATIENLQPKLNMQVNMYSVSIVRDGDGINYNLDNKATNDLTTGFKIGNLEAGQKTTGQLAYLVPKNAASLKWIYKIDLVEGTTVEYQVK